MNRIRLLLQYDGTGYSGWQVQCGKTTIQGLIEDSLQRITGEETRVVAAGRTDAGAHALGQVASFSTKSPHPPEVFQRALNAMLPEQIRVLDARSADQDFHPRYSARAKRYFYLIENSGIKNPFLCRYSYHVHERLDMERMREAGMHLVGRHDFSAFRDSGCGARTTLRLVNSIEVIRLKEAGFLGLNLPGSFINISIEADAFLRHMARNIAGTLIEAGRGRFTPEHVMTILMSGDRRNAGPTVPAKGLFLERVFY